MASSASKIGPKFQVTLPKGVREAAGFSIGDYLVEENTYLLLSIISHPK